jgi:hypothetical protein
MAATAAGNTTQFKGTGIGVLQLDDVALLVGYAILMLGVCTLACVVPTVRALRVQPTEALRAECWQRPVLEARLTGTPFSLD